MRYSDEIKNGDPAYQQENFASEKHNPLSSVTAECKGWSRPGPDAGS